MKSDFWFTACVVVGLTAVVVDGCAERIGLYPCRDRMATKPMFTSTYCAPGQSMDVQTGGTRILCTCDEEGEE